MEANENADQGLLTVLTESNWYNFSLLVLT